MKDVNFGLSIKFDNGCQTSVAINNAGRVLEVHKSEIKDKLWYRTGRTRQMGVSWDDSINYDSGVTPSVALNNDGVAVEVHRAEFGINLWYNVGFPSKDGKLEWGGSHKYDKGVQPSIAINNKFAVEVHKAEVWDKLWCRVGAIKGDKTVEWGDSHKYDSGVTPSVAINTDGIAVEVHRAEFGIDLWYRVGVIKGNKTVEWGDSHKYDSGVTPSVAITDDGFVVEIHKNELGIGLWKRSGTVNRDKKEIKWHSESVFFDTGLTPSVAVANNGAMAIQTHQAEGSIGMYFSTSLVNDRMRWMEHNYNKLSEKQLWEITLPGTHDSGAYDMETVRTTCYKGAPDWIPGDVIRRFATAQNQTIAGQLNGGARHFDLRPFYRKEKDGFYAYHDVIGASFDLMLAETAHFLENTKHELIFLRIQNFCKFNDEEQDRHKQFIELIKGKLSKYFYKNVDANLLTTTLEEIVDEGSKVIIWYEHDYIVANPEVGFWRRISMFDSFSDTDNYDKLKKDQLEKLKKNSGTAEELFPLSWNLTFKDWESILEGLSLREMAKEPNRNLGQFIAENVNGYQINFIYVDFPFDARSTDCAIMLNQSKGDERSK